MLNDRQNIIINHSVVNQKGWTSKTEAVHGPYLMGKEETLVMWLPDGALQIIIVSYLVSDRNVFSELQQCKMTEPPDGKVISISCPPALSIIWIIVCNKWILKIECRLFPLHQREMFEGGSAQGWTFLHQSQIEVSALWNKLWWNIEVSLLEMTYEFS